MSTITVRIRRKGVITIPASLRRKYGLREGETLTLTDLGEGTLLLSRGSSGIDWSGDQIARVMREKGVTLDEVVHTLDEERETYFQEKYGAA